jgi:hypothetical protein
MRLRSGRNSDCRCILAAGNHPRHYYFFFPSRAFGFFLAVAFFFAETAGFLRVGAGGIVLGSTASKPFRASANRRGLSVIGCDFPAIGHHS